MSDSLLHLLLEHNPRHYTPVRIFGEKYNICSRCLGIYSGGIVSFIIFVLLGFYGYSFDFSLIFLLSWVLASICIFDWAGAKTSLWSGDNRVRIISGVCLAVAVNMWAFLLPVSMFDRFWSLFVIGTTFGILVMFVNYRELKKGLFDEYQNFFLKYNRIYCCDLGCCTTICCVLPQYLIYVSIILCCCVCPILLICLIFKR